MQSDIARLQARIARLEAENDLLRGRFGAPWTFLHHAPVAVQVFDRDGLTEYLNLAQARFLGLADPTVPVGRFNVLTEPFTEQNGSRAYFLRAYAGELVTLPEMRLDVPVDDPRWDLEHRDAWYEQILVPLRDGTHAVEHVVSFILDVTPRKHAERALVAAQRHAGLSVLAGGIAHDFNNLLTAILGNATLGLQAGSSVGDMREALTHVSRAAETASALTRQLLAYAGKGGFVMEPVCLCEVVRDMTELLRASVPHNISLDVTSTAPGERVLADVSQLQQVVMNLITNAAEAIGAAPGIVTIQTARIDADPTYLAESFGQRGLDAGAYMTLEVSDTGGGMPAHIVDRIFDPFFTTKDRGHGLGLAAVAGIIRSYKGAVRVYTEPGQGTSIKVLVPVHRGVVEAETDPDLEPASPVHHATVLVVDDERVLRVLARRVLERAGFAVIEAANGVECLERYRPGEVDLVFLDLSMPKMDGTTAFRELRRVDSGVKVLLTSGYSERATTAKFAGKGLAGFLQKPYTTGQLLEAIRSLLPGD